MKLLTLLLTLSLASWPVARINKSVVPMHFKVDENSISFCSAFSINSNGRYITAAHCAPEGAQLFINDDTPAVVTESDPSHDLAVITASVGLPALKLGSKPKQGQRVLMYGNLGYVGFPLFFEGLSLSEQKLGDTEIRFVINSPVPYGLSGSPILDEKGRVVSVIQCGGEDNIAILTCGATYDVLKALFKKYGE